jgi:formylglycine-generating enzyme required for sulfatase activity
MVRRRMRRFVTGSLLAAAALALSTCQPGDLALKTYYANLTVRETLLPIQWVRIAPAAAGFYMGDLAQLAAPSWPITLSRPLSGEINIVQKISYKFYISKFEITNEQYAQFIADGGYSKPEYWTTNAWAWYQSRNPKLTEPGWWQDSNYNAPTQPVVGVRWWEAVAYCNWRSVIEGLTPAYDATGRADLTASGYRLPTEVEWEYAAAGGSAENVFPWGSTWDSSKAVCSVSPNLALTKTSVVGSLPAGDAAGVSDLAGNVWEWCSDNYQDDASVVSGTDRYYFVDDMSSAGFAYRGGAYSTAPPYAELLRCAYRGGLQVRPYSFWGPAQGFRIVHRLG